MDTDKTSINHGNGDDANRFLAVVTPAMKSFAGEYALWIVSVGQNYINALSPKFTTEDSMCIFLRDYYGKGWMG